MFTRSVPLACIESNLLLLFSDIFLTSSTEIIKDLQEIVQSVVEISLLTVWRFD